MSTKIKSGIIEYASYKEACEKHGVSYMVFYMRVTKLGWSVAKALRKPVRKYEPKPIEENEIENMSARIMFAGGLEG